MVTQSSDVPTLPDGLVAVVKRDCATCELVGPVLGDLQRRVGVTVYSQDDPTFPETVDGVVDDTWLGVSWHHDIETVPTLLRVEGGKEVDRTIGWQRTAWSALSGVDDLGPDLPDQRPGCGSLSVDPTLTDELAVRFGGSTLRSRRVELAQLEDEMEAAFDRGWTDGLPVVPPTEARVLRMLEGTDRAPDEIVAAIPPDLVEATVEQIAVNAVMAGCRPEYFDVVLTAIEGACSAEFNMHGLLATTFFSGPILVVNGPVARRIGMNADGNVFGQGNRANMTIGRALQLVVRNLGGGRPGEIDMACQGSPGKLGFCFTETPDGPLGTLATEAGFAPDADTVTLFAGQGPTPVVDQLSRTPESLVRSFATVLRSVHHPKLVIGMDAMLVVAPEHAAIFAEAGWDRARLRAELEPLLMIDGEDLVRDPDGSRDGIAEGLPAAIAEGATLPKFRPGGLLIASAGGPAGLFSSVLTGWVGGAKGSEPVTIGIARTASTHDAGAHEGTTR